MIFWVSSILKVNLDHFNGQNTPENPGVDIKIVTLHDLAAKLFHFYLEDFAVFEVLSSCCLYVCMYVYVCQQPAFFSGSTCSFLHWNRASYGQYL